MPYDLCECMDMLMVAIKCLHNFYCGVMYDNTTYDSYYNNK